MARLEDNSLRSFLDSEFADPGRRNSLESGTTPRRRDGAEVNENRNNADVTETNDNRNNSLSTQELVDRDNARYGNTFPQGSIGVSKEGEKQATKQKEEKKMNHFSNP